MSWRRRLTGDAVVVHDQWRCEQGLAPLTALAKLRLRIAAIASSNPLVRMSSNELRHDFFIRADSSDEYVFQQVYQDREYDIDFPSPKTIVDAGANIGLASILFASRYPNASIIAVEPDADNFAVLSRNTASYSNVRCVQAGVWHRDAKLERVSDDAKPWAYRFQETTRPDGLPSISLDQVAEMFPSKRVDLAKIDIEGAERDVLRPDANWLKSVVTVLVETHDRVVSGCEAAISSAMPDDQFTRSVNGENHVFIRRPTVESPLNVS